PAHQEEGLPQDHLLGREELAGPAEAGRRLAVGEPSVVSLGQPIARAVDDIDVVLFDLGLAEPVGKGQVRLEACRGEPLQESEGVLAAHEDVQALRPPHGAGVMAKRVATAYEERNLERDHSLQGAAVAPTPDL